MADTYTVEREIRVDAPASAVYERIVDFHRWPAWSPYEELDPGMARTYAGAESGLGRLRVVGQPQGRVRPDGDRGRPRR